MKKFAITLTICMAILLCGKGIFAAEFPSIGMKIDFPKNYYSLKDGIENQDSKAEYYISILQTTKENLQNEYKQNSILYNGVKDDFSSEIYVYESSNKITNKIFNLSTAKSNQLDEVKEEIKSIIKSQGMTVSAQDMYTVGNISYIYSTIKNKDTTIYQYYTIVNGKSITISLNTSDTSNKSEEIKQVVDTAKFDKIEEKPTEISTYILIGVTAALILMVIVLMFMAFSNKGRKTKETEEDYEDDTSTKED